MNEPLHDFAQQSGLSARRAFVAGGLGIALGPLSGALRSGGAASGKRRRRGKVRKQWGKNGQCRKPGESCRSHKECCIEGGMCIAMIRGDGHSSVRCCAAA